ncbi:MAG: hypothetical protein ABJB98_05205 [Actinomycetota bacterium]
MRWDGLFADLEAQAAALDTAERAAEIEERARIGVAQLRLVDRLRAAVDSPIKLACTGGVVLDGLLRRVSPDWLLLDEGAGREAIVVVAAVLHVSGLGRFSAAASLGVVESRLGLRHALRGVARDRVPVRLHLSDASVLSGTLDRIGSDFVELAAHAAGEPRRRGDVRDVLVVALGNVVVVRRDG